MSQSPVSILPEGHPVTAERLSELAKYLFHLEVQGSKLDMLDYENNTVRRENWERKVAKDILALDARVEQGE